MEDGKTVVARTNVSFTSLPRLPMPKSRQIYLPGGFGSDCPSKADCNAHLTADFLDGGVADDV